MTTETRTTIEFGDIARIEFECPKCHSRFAQELTEQNIVATSCKNGVCKQPFIVDQSTEHAALQSAFDLMGRYSKAGKGAFILRLELKPLASQKSAQAQ